MGVIVVGMEGAVFTSPDGTAWTKRVCPFAYDTGSTPPRQHTVYGIAYSPVHQRFAIVGGNKECGYSPDGVDWTLGTFATGWSTNESPSTIAVNPTTGRMVTANGIQGYVGEGGSTAYSDDGGMTWTNGGVLWALDADGQRAPVGQIHYAAFIDKFIAVAAEKGNGRAAPISASDDGITWTEGTVDQTGAYNSYAEDAWLYFTCVASNDSIAVVGGGASSGSALTSTDGLNWTVAHVFSAPSDTLTGLAWSPLRGVFAGTGRDNNYTSPDGATWTQRDDANNHTDLIRKMVWSAQHLAFFAVGEERSSVRPVQKSSDGTMWVPVSGSSVIYSPDDWYDLLDVTADGYVEQSGIFVPQMGWGIPLAPGHTGVGA